MLYQAKKYVIFTLLWLAVGLRKLLLRSETAYGVLLLPQFESLRVLVGKWKAWRVFELAARRCPAYRDFVQKTGSRIRLRGLVPDFGSVAPTDKPNYVKAYSIDARCLDGRIPTRGATIDQSSGSTGKPNNWVRGADEREEGGRIMRLALRDLVGREPIFFINAFALGPWATGMTVSRFVGDESILMSIGPDASKILTILEDFGPKYRYIIAGYPPFLKGLVDSRPLEWWSQYRIVAFFGGEAISENQRAYLGRAFQRIYSSYGASDLEINVAAENDFVIALRREMERNERLRHRLNGPTAVHSKRLLNGKPMIFQYNPLDYMVETNEQGELLVTLCRASNLAPKVRYNIHDTGHVMKFDEVRRILAEEGISTAGWGHSVFNLPLMFHYGRSDMSVAFYGCKITPGDLEDVFFGIPDLAHLMNAFTVITSEDGASNKRLELAIELVDGAAAPADAAGLQARVLDDLAKVNQDWRESRRMVPAGAVTLSFYPKNQGPFVDSDIRLKSKYIRDKK